MARVRFKKKININRVVVKIVASVLGLYVGGYILQEIGSVLECTYSPFYQGLSLIGYTVQSSLTVVNSTVPTTCNTADGLSAGTYTDIITATSGTGLLAVVGIVVVASIVTEFVEFSM